MVHSLAELLKLKKQIRVIGFDDAPFQKERNSPVKIAGIVCSDTRFEGMLWAEVAKDGTDATKALIELIRDSKFYDQINVVLLDGIAFGGFNIVNLPELSEQLNRPCLVVMRKYPDISAVNRALLNFSDHQQRKRLIIRAGKIYMHHPFYFQVSGCLPDTAAKVLDQLTDTGNVPEALRIAHLIGAAVMTGESSSRA